MTAQAARGWFGRLKEGLARSSSRLSQGIAGIFTGRKLDQETLQALEELLIAADLGPETAARITGDLGRSRFNTEITEREAREALAELIAKILAPVAVPLAIDPARKPHVVLVVGVNGTGKTTTIGKLAKQFHDEGRSVMLCAGDTFRAAAIDQLKVWGERAKAEVVAREPGANAAGLVFDALSAARAKAVDVLLIDTAGRLHNKAHLMEELDKIIRVMRKLDPEAPHSTLLVLDATTGQNAHAQVELFRATAPLSGLVVTKLDGTARGGVLVALAARFGLPVNAIGIGEGIEDLRPFAADDFARSLLDL
ncbi:MAG: signal recognition particle-docking protein FtsY [Alphaproteobacteria bacterium]